MKAMKHLKLAAAGMLGLCLTANLSAQTTDGQPVFENPVNAAIVQSVQAPVMDPAPLNYFQQDCCGGMQSMSLGGMEYAVQADILEGDAAHITITVPEKAKIFVNGDPTASTGPVRNFVVRRLAPGEQYKFVFRAEMENAAGVKLEEKRELMLKLGDSESFSLTPWEKVPVEEEVPAEVAPAK